MSKEPMSSKEVLQRRLRRSGRMSWLIVLVMFLGFATVNWSLSLTMLILLLCLAPLIVVTAGFISSYLGL